MDDDSAIVIPKWAAYFVSCVSSLFLVAFMPWAAWVSLALATLTVRFEAYQRLDQRVATVEKKVSDHVSDPEVHHTGIVRLEQRIKQLELAGRTP